MQLGVLRGSFTITLAAVGALGAEPPGLGVDVGAVTDATTPQARQAAAAAAGAASAARKKQEFPPFKDVAKDYTQVVSRAQGAKSLYTVWVNKKEHQALAELNPAFEGQKIFIATSIAGGSPQTGWQWKELYCYWSRHHKKLVLMEPQLRRRAGGGKGNEELSMAVQRTYNDRVITSVPILTMGPNRAPVIDLDALLIGQSKIFTEKKGNASLAKIGEVKVFPNNIEVPVTIPMAKGQMTTVHYSISVIPKTDYKPREADDRVGYFMTVYKDLTKVAPDGRNFVRYVNRWNLQKRDTTLPLSPPAEPIVFYIEHTVPVRYRRYVRQGILEWNKAFEQCGIIDAVEVRQQDARTGSFMDIDPEDVRYNFFRWISSETPFAMGPSRVNPETGEILDADIIFDDSMLKYYALRYQRLIAAYGFDGVDPEALAWIADRPSWHPLARAHAAGSGAAQSADDDEADHAHVVQQNRYCGYATGKAMQMRTAHLAMRLLPQVLGETPATPTIDGVPEEYLGGILKEIVMHEVGHTLGLRHNFKASAWLSLDQYVVRNGEANVGSVMDYNPIFVPTHPESPRGEWVTPTIGPYDYWAIEFGYTLDPKKHEELFKRVAAKELQFATDEDAWGPDPHVARFDLGAEPLDWAERRLELVRTMRGRLVDKAVEEGQSWYLLRQAYEQMLAEQLGALRIAGRYVGGVHMHRDHKGDPNARDPLTPTDATLQRRALTFLLENGFRDEAYDLRPEVLRKLAADKHRHWGNNGTSDVAFSVHDNVGQIQSFALLYLLNPGTLTRVYDNELRTNLEDDMLTLPEVMEAVVDEVFREFSDKPAGPFTNRQPMISSLRRNLQSETLGRLIDLAIDGSGMPRPVRTLATGHLWRLQGQLVPLIDQAAAGEVDEYTLVHLSDMKERIDKALNSVYVTGLVRQRIELGGMVLGF